MGSCEHPTSVVMVLLAMSVCVAQVTQPTQSTFDTPTTSNRTAHISDFETTSTTTTTSANGGCGGVARCTDDQYCSACLTAINASSNFPHTISQYYSPSALAGRTYQSSFFSALLTTPSCATNNTPPSILRPALQELATPRCNDAYGMVVGVCLPAEYACFVDGDCRVCLTALYTARTRSEAGGGTDGSAEAKSAVLSSLACTSTSPSFLQDLTVSCTSFPRCTFAKKQCLDLPRCSECMVTLNDNNIIGRGQQAARQCPAGDGHVGDAMENFVNACFDNSAIACNFYLQQCTGNANCSACLGEVGDGESARAIALEWATPSCQRAIPDHTAMSTLQYFAVCPGIGSCRVTIANCIGSYGNACIACMDGSAPLAMESTCRFLLQQYDVGAACSPCPNSVHTINIVVMATAVVGGVSVMVCLVVVSTIVAHEHDRVAFRDRIVIGLMLANAVYSTANAIPLNAVHTGVVNCGRLAMSFDAIRFGRSWWFCGKYGLVSFELLIVGASIWALLRGTRSTVAPRAEVTLHTGCCVVAIVAFVVFYTMCVRINESGYNIGAETESFTDAFNYGSSSDDLDDDAPYRAASQLFQSGRDEYDNLVRKMLVAWDVLVGVAIVMWITLRLMYQHALHALRAEAAAAARAEEADVWADTRRSAWEARRKLLDARQGAFTEVAKPLEPYIAVFFAFTAPAFLMSTSFCQRHSGVEKGADVSSERGWWSGTFAGADNFTYGTCFVWCEFVLAFRTLGTVAVYLLPRARRTELVAMRTTWRKLTSRVYGCCARIRRPYTLLDGDAGTGYEMRDLSHLPNSHATDDGAGNAWPTATEESWQHREEDFAMVERIGNGSFGEVWEGVLRADGRPVAIKVLLARAVDEEGDPIDTNADGDFRKEVAALQRIDSPHLLKFYGYGTMASGHGFILTELMVGGSLEDLLHDRTRDLPWRTRVSIGLQVALGMEHMHHKHMLHRDLKSGNVVLDEQLRAKVCDFGLSRVARHARQRVVHSPFTGVTRLLPAANCVEINDIASCASMVDVAVIIEDAQGSMTKAAGTLLWMAPEVFRGDCNYTNAVDTYSFGVVLWELATRETPWHELLQSTDVAFFSELNRALQTGRRPTISDAVRANHGAFVRVMQRCWAGDPADRPPFTVVVNNLSDCLRDEP